MRDPGSVLLLALCLEDERSTVREFGVMVCLWVLTVVMMAVSARGSASQNCPHLIYSEITKNSRSLGKLSRAVSSAVP